MVPGRPASAHTSLKETSPAAGASVASPEKVVLTFADAVIFPNVAVVDAAGKPRQAGKAKVSDNKVTVRIAGTLPGGTYQVAWRAVSPDGHPISGRYSFTVTGSPGDGNAAATAAPAASDGTGRGGWLWLGLIVLALAVPAAAYAGLRSRRTRTAPAPGASEQETSEESRTD